MQLQDILYSQGFGTRRICAGLVQQGLVTVNGEPCDDSTADFDPTGLWFTVQGKPWPYHEKAYILLVVGYPADDATVPAFAKVKKPLEAISTFI